MGQTEYNFLRLVIFTIRHAVRVSVGFQSAVSTAASADTQPQLNLAMSVDIAALDASPRRSLRRSSTLEQKPPSEIPNLKSTTGNGKKRFLENDDAPILDSSFSSVKDEDEDEDEEAFGGPPPLKKVARTSGAGGAIMWKTTTGAPKQLAFKKAVGPASNGPSAKSTTTTAPAAPLNLATALAGLLPSKPTASSSLPTVVPKRQLLLKPSGMAPRITTSISSPSTSHFVRCRVDKVNNEICNGCVKSLPTLRRSLGRLETRMEAVTSMIKQIVNKHSQQNVAFARVSNSISRGCPSTMASASSSSSSLNGNGMSGKPTAMRFVPITGRKTAASPANSVMRKFVAEKNGRLAPGSLMYRMISRGLLTYRSPVLTADEYYKQAPNVIKAHTLKQVQQVMEDLVASGLYNKSDSSVDTMDPECIFEKETDMSKLNRLSEYGVNAADFLPDGYED